MDFDFYRPRLICIEADENTACLSGRCSSPRIIANTRTRYPTFSLSGLTEANRPIHAADCIRGIKGSHPIGEPISAKTV